MRSKDCYDERLSLSASGTGQSAIGGFDLARVRAAAGAVLGALRAWDDRARQRRRLAEMDERQLRDLGIDRVDALREAWKPFWRA